MDKFKRELELSAKDMHAAKNEVNVRQGLFVRLPFITGDSPMRSRQWCMAMIEREVEWIEFYSEKVARFGGVGYENRLIESLLDLALFQSWLGDA